MPRTPSFKPFSVPKQSLDSSTKGSPITLDVLLSIGFPNGLARTLESCSNTFPLRIWILDNSRSMMIADGCHISLHSDLFELRNCSRWEEIKETVLFHAELSTKIHTPTVFRLLNKPFSPRIPREFGVGLDGPAWIRRDIQIIHDTMKKIDPKGCTPITRRLFEIRENLMNLKEQLELNDQKVVIVIATDGIPTNRDGESPIEIQRKFIKVLESFHDLPSCLVVRLCTQDHGVVQFYRNLERRLLHLDFKVLDDYFEEAKTIVRYNRWINYAMPLHRAREMGFSHPIFSVLGERKLDLKEVQDYFSMLFGPDVTNCLPDPLLDFKDFLKGAKVILSKLPKQYNPSAKKATQWVDLKGLAISYMGYKCQIM
jgi:hypothetical protein